MNQFYLIINVGTWCAQHLSRYLMNKNKFTACDVANARTQNEVRTIPHLFFTIFMEQLYSIDSYIHTLYILLQQIKDIKVNDSTRWGQILKKLLWYLSISRNAIIVLITSCLAYHWTEGTAPFKLSGIFLNVFLNKLRKMQSINILQAKLKLEYQKSACHHFNFNITTKLSAFLPYAVTLAQALLQCHSLRFWPMLRLQRHFVSFLIQIQILAQPFLYIMHPKYK